MAANDPDIPYNDLPLLPPRKEIETPAVLKACLGATRAVAELKGAGGLIPDQSILINAIPLQEAKASSEIENIVTTQDDLFRGDLNDSKKSDPSTKEVLRYRTALREGYETLSNGGGITLDLVRKICSTILDEEIDFRASGQDVYIGNTATKKASYTPPEGGEPVAQLLTNLEQYIKDGSSGIDPLIRMPIIHYQFEAIHPFTDGNGRTGRILNILYLIQAGLLEIPVLYLSRHIIRHKRAYYDMLRAVTEDGAWEAWLLYMLEGVEQTARWTTDRIHDIRDLLNETVELVRSKEPGIYTKELVELIFRQPYCKIAFLVDAGIVQRQTASEYLQKLESIGVLVGEKQGREVIYRNPRLIGVLTA